MRDARALLIANSVSYADTDKSIPVTVVKSIAKDFEAYLENLGEYSFKTTSIINQTTDEARQLIRQNIRQARSSDLLLIYYFGHGVKSVDDDLLLYFKDSDYREPPSLLDFSDIVKLLRGYKLAKTIIILDCCYAGTIRDKLKTIEGFDGDYYLMASVTHKGKAEVDYGDSRPIGVFSKYVLDAFINLGARVPFTRDVTAGSLFEFVDELTRSRSMQVPYRLDGGLANEVLFRQTSAVRIAPSVKTSVPRKSSYHKLYTLCSLLSQATFQTEDAFYGFLDRKPPREFLTPHKVNLDTVEYRFMGRDAFCRYLELAAELGMLELGTPLRLTALGKSMTRNDGKRYNIELHNALTGLWAQYKVTMSDLEDAIGARMRGNGVPTLDGVYFDMFLSKKIFMGKNMFKTLIDLTGYVGALKFTREPTYFLPTSYEGEPKE